MGTSSAAQMSKFPACLTSLADIADTGKTPVRAEGAARIFQTDPRGRRVFRTRPTGHSVNAFIIDQHTLWNMVNADMVITEAAGTLEHPNTDVTEPRAWNSTKY